jgi:hypothetical protein
MFHGDGAEGLKPCYVWLVVEFLALEAFRWDNVRTFYVTDLRAMLRSSSDLGGLCRILCRRAILVAREVEVERVPLNFRG